MGHFFLAYETNLRIHSLFITKFWMWHSAMRFYNAFQSTYVMRRLYRL